MSVFHNLIAGLIDIEEAELSELERIVRHLRLRHPFTATSMRFDGPFFTNADGEIIVASKILTLGQPYTGLLLFANASGASGKGPVGEISSSDPSVTASLSADGQSYNTEIVTELTAPVTVTWHDPTGAIPDATMVVDTAEDGQFVATSVSFGDPSPGTTE